jgi:hypothetical protein
MVVGELTSPSSKLPSTKEEGGGKNQPLKQQSNEAMRHKATKQQMGGGS